MKTISREELKKRLDAGKVRALLNVLSKESFKSEHIRGSVNVPFSSDGFEKKVKAMFPDKNGEIIVHCGSFECPASTMAAKQMEAMGYKNVVHYKGGIKDWKEAGYPLERGGENRG